MYFKQILDERCGRPSYVIASRETHEAAIVDPSVHLEEYDSLLAERKFTLRYVIDTHVHADHVSGARALVARHPDAELCPLISGKQATKSAKSPTVNRPERMAWPAAISRPPVPIVAAFQ